MILILLCKMGDYNVLSITVNYFGNRATTKSKFFVASVVTDLLIHNKYIIWNFATFLVYFITCIILFLLSFQNSSVYNFKFQALHFKYSLPCVLLHILYIIFVLRSFEILILTQVHVVNWILYLLFLQKRVVSDTYCALNQINHKIMW